jgi:hypothetical protein
MPVEPVLGPHLQLALARIFHELLSRDRETGNPLAGLSGLSRRSFSEDGSGASAKRMGVRPGRRLRNSECELRIEILQKARENQRTNGEI